MSVNNELKNPQCNDSRFWTFERDKLLVSFCSKSLDKCNIEWGKISKLFLDNHVRITKAACKKRFFFLLSLEMPELELAKVNELFFKLLKQRPRATLKTVLNRFVVAPPGVDRAPSPKTAESFFAVSYFSTIMRFWKQPDHRRLLLFGVIGKYFDDRRLYTRKKNLEQVVDILQRRIEEEELSRLEMGKRSREEGESAVAVEVPLAKRVKFVDMSSATSRCDEGSPSVDDEDSFFNGCKEGAIYEMGACSPLTPR